ncbi:sporulation integral membrane protein YtvI [Paenibacillus chitinolyticus]|uniref:sporulation integral membrane protein YtvI n=1 Tax=Paenibacillus chitinolyticus TaxID=79263 RepID=UPI002DBCF470|nr:sporulation integral membrane protein YtvI [Paenibacillus chitinolyticus]MEC0246584.1 sporulation integral membrane protein YtvI [Paenibacillus chitinolyticus]
MISFYKRYYKTILDIGLIVLTVFLFMKLFSFIYSIATPIFWAFIIFAMIEPLARFLHRRGLKKMLATTISTLLFILVILAVFTGAGFLFTSQIDNLVTALPKYTQMLQEQITKRTIDLQNSIEALPPDVIEKSREIANQMATKATSFATNFLKTLLNFLTSGVMGLVTSFSTFMLNFVAGVILAFFLSLEIDWWKKNAREKTPKTFRKAFDFLRENVIKGIVSYLKSQLILISITFVMVLISLMILGVDNAFTISLLAAFFDVLPLLGVSTLFVPWIVYHFIAGSTMMGIWLTVVLAVVVLVRQVLEPKITGESLGVSAFTMLSFMIISLSLFGVAGVILSPILIILIKALYDQGYLRKWIRSPEDEY